MKKTFTLIELVIIILIVGIVAALMLPTFVDLSTEATEVAIDSAIGALREAISAKHAENIVGGDDSYPIDNPFSLLATAPPNKTYASQPTPNGNHWRYRRRSGRTVWYLYCPYFDGRQGGAGATVGRMYLYQYGDSGTWGYSAGDLWLQKDEGY